MRRLLIIMAVVSVLTGACSAGTSGTSRPAAGEQQQAQDEAPFELSSVPVATNEVRAVKSYRFDPDVIEIAIDSEVVWTNDDDFPHNVHLLNDGETHDLPIGESVGVTFDQAGEFYYECSLHPQQMRGKVIVSE